MSEYDCVGVTSEYLDSLKNKIIELEQQKAELINILKSIVKAQEDDDEEFDRISKEIIKVLNKHNIKI